MTRLRQDTSPAALALQVTILCALRTSETRLAQWSEFDFAAMLWTIPGGPAGRMKNGKEHRVPLTSPVVEILERLRQTATDRFVFAAPGEVKPIGQNAMLKILARLRVRTTVHGLRSSFSDWAAETTNFPGEVREMALAHAVPSAVEAAYRRGDLFQKRRLLMQLWADFLTGDYSTENVVVDFSGARHAV